MNSEQKKFIELNIKGKTIDELVELLNKKFNSNISKSKVINYKKRKKLKSCINTKFQKMSKPHNYKPILSEFINSNGYTEIKVAEPNVWKLKHRYIYEKHFGKIKDGYSVVFANGNKQDFRIDNLLLVRTKDKLVAKNKKLFSSDPNITKTGILLSQLINKVSDIKKVK